MADRLSRGAGRGAAARLIRDLLRDPAVTVVAVARTRFDHGLDLYEKGKNTLGSLTPGVRKPLPRPALHRYRSLAPVDAILRQRSGESEVIPPRRRDVRHVRA